MTILNLVLAFVFIKLHIQHYSPDISFYKRRILKLPAVLYANDRYHDILFVAKIDYWIQIVVFYHFYCHNLALEQF